jgi:hypothetical protein
MSKLTTPTDPTPTDPTGPTVPTDPRVPKVATAPADTRPRDLPVRVFRISAVAMATFVLAGPGGASYLAAPWRVVGEPDPHIPFDLHRWHVTDITAFVALLLVGALLACALAPRRSAPAAQSFLASVAALSAAGLFIADPAMILMPCAGLTLLFLATYPQRRQLLRWHRSPRTDRPAIAVAAAATPYLLFDLARNIELQVIDTGQHGELGHWAIGAALSAGLLVAGWLAATGGRSGRGLRSVLGVTYLYLGIAALTIPRHDGSWSTPGGLFALLLSIGFIVTLRSSRANLGRRT